MSVRVNFGIMMFFFQFLAVVMVVKLASSLTLTYNHREGLDGWICDACQTYKYARAWSTVCSFPPPF